MYEYIAVNIIEIEDSLINYKLTFPKLQIVIFHVPKNSKNKYLIIYEMHLSSSRIYCFFFNSVDLFLQFTY